MDWLWWSHLLAGQVASYHTPHVFSCGVCERQCWPYHGGWCKRFEKKELKLLLHQLMLTCCSIHDCSRNITWMLRDKWCPCWIWPVFRTNLYISFHKVLKVICINSDRCSAVDKNDTTDCQVLSAIVRVCHWWFTNSMSISSHKFFISKFVKVKYIYKFAHERRLNEKIQTCFEGAFSLHIHVVCFCFILFLFCIYNYVLPVYSCIHTGLVICPVLSSLHVNWFELGWIIVHSTMLSILSMSPG